MAVLFNRSYQFHTILYFLQITPQQAYQYLILLREFSFVFYFYQMNRLEIWNCFGNGSLCYTAQYVTGPLLSLPSVYNYISPLCLCLVNHKNGSSVQDFLPVI